MTESVSASHLPPSTAMITMFGRFSEVAGPSGVLGTSTLPWAPESTSAGTGWAFNPNLRASVLIVKGW